MPKLTSKEIIKALKKGEHIGCHGGFPRYVYLCMRSNGELFIKDWGQDMGEFKPNIKMLETDSYYNAEHEVPR